MGNNRSPSMAIRTEKTATILPFDAYQKNTLLTNWYKIPFKQKYKEITPANIPMI